MDRPYDQSPGPNAATADATDGLRVIRDPEESPNTELIGTGSLLRGRYRLTTVIGRGGMADVYRAMDQVLAREVAVKVFRPGTDRGADRKRFLGEVHTLAGLTHPHLVALYDGGQHEAQPWCVMQLVDGGTLADLDGAQSLTMIAGIGAQIADGLAYIHDRGIVHRDVKPSNVLLDGLGGAFLSDFGVAQIVDATRMTATGALLGTAAYLSPEQVRGRPATTAVDVYALALVLLEVITGQREFPGAPVESAVARLSRPPHIPDQLGPAWAQLLAAMSDIEPERRPDAATAAGALRALARQEHVEAVTVPVQRVGRVPASWTPSRGTPITPAPAEYDPSTTVIRMAQHATPGRPPAVPGLGARIVRSLTVNPAGTAAVSLAMVLAVVGLTQLPGLDPGGSVSPDTSIDSTGNEPNISGGGLGDGVAGQTGEVDGPSAEWWAEPVSPATTSRNTRTIVAGTGTTVDGPTAPPASTTKPASPSPSPSPSKSPSPSPTPTPSTPSPTPTPSATDSVPPSPDPTPTDTPTTPEPTPSSSSGTGGGGLGGPSTGSTPTSSSPTSSTDD